MSARALHALAAGLLVVACVRPVAAQPDPSPRSVAVTFDDLPLNTLQTDFPTWQSATARLLDHVAAHGVQAIGFVNEGKLFPDGTRDADRVALLQRWLDAGLELGNHTYSHPDLHDTPLAAFQEDVVRGEAVTSELLAASGATPRYFRHPFLHTGRDLETRAELTAFLQGRGYRVAPVTIDNQEYIFARAYERALLRDERSLADRIADAYVAYMEDVFAYYEEQSRGLFGREIAQVLLLHANVLNADTFGDLAAMMQRRGYAFITLDEALRDPAYASEDAYTGPAGITWIHRWALTRRVERSFFQGEPEAPAFVVEQSGL